jgi:hypothetical protein
MSNKSPAFQFYPQREQFFAHRFVRLLHKAAVAAEIGRDAFSLLVVIVHTEDAMRYRGPAKFWNSQLVETLGFTKWDQFDKARRRAIESGWLQYSGNGKRTSGEYFVTIPAGYESVSDSPLEPTCTLVNPENGYKDGYDHGYKDGYKQGIIEGTNRGQTGVQTGDKQGEPSIPIPNPNPIPIPENTIAPETGEVAKATPASVGKKREAAPISYIADQFVAAFGGRLHITPKRIKAANTRWQDAWWRDHWQEALDRGSGSAFLRGENDTGWKCDIDWFLKPDSVARILEGKYDGAGKPRQQTAAERREQLNASSFDLIRQAAAAAAAEREAANASSGNCRIEVSPGT